MTAGQQNFSANMKTPLVRSSRGNEPHSERCQSEPRYLGCYHKAKAAFTLVEMLVVISIIGILAALIINALPAVTEKKIRSKVNAERAAVESAIERYKLDKGFYPPDNLLFTNFPSLYYELQGFDVPAVPASIKIQAQMLGITNIINVRHQGVEDEDAKNFLKNVRQDQIVETNGVRFLAVKTRAPDNSDFTLWGYDMHSPDRHNHESFDLWADVKIGNKIVRLGNWRD